MKAHHIFLNWQTKRLWKVFLSGAKYDINNPEASFIEEVKLLQKFEARHHHNVEQEFLP